MSRIFLRVIYLPMVAMVLTSALAVPATAQKQVPFKGTFQGNDTVSPPTLTQRITGVGTHLGEFSSTTVITFPAHTGVGHWIAANGDSIDTTGVGSAVDVDMAPCQVEGAQPGDTYVKSTQIHTITGGTGRFAGVKGSFTITLYHDIRLSNDGTHHTCGSFEGTITPPGAAN